MSQWPRTLLKFLGTNVHSHTHKTKREIQKHMYSEQVPVVSTYFYKTVNEHAHSTLARPHTMHTLRSSLVIGRVRWLESRLSNVEEIREASGGHRVTSAKKALSVSTWSTKGWRAGERKDVLCNCPLSLSYTHIPTQTPHDLFLSEHENTKSSFWTTTKNGLCFIHLGKQQKKNKEILCRLVYYWHRLSIAHLSHSHSYTFTNIFTSTSNPHLFWFFLLFFITFLGKCKSSSFF